MDYRAIAKRLLWHYFRLVLVEAGITKHTQLGDLQAEVEGIVDDILAAARAESKDQIQGLQDQITSLQNQFEEHEAGGYRNMR